MGPSIIPTQQPPIKGIAPRWSSFGRSLAACERRVRRSLRRYALNFGQKHGSIAILSLALRSESFAAECRAVRNGVWQHDSFNRTSDAIYYTLRRNIHRLEKGLLMQRRKNIYATGFIVETVQCYGLAVRNPSSPGNHKFLKYAHDVIRRYFDICHQDPTVDQARREFEKCASAFLFDSAPRIPFSHGSLTRLPAMYDDLLRLAGHRKSVRWYLPKAVPRELIDKAVNVAKLAPSACNRQPFEFLVFDTPDAVKLISSIPMGAQGFGYNIPLIIAVIGNLAAFSHERDRHLIYIDSALASMSLLLAMESLGLSTCCINWPEVSQKETEATKLLHLESTERIVMLIAGGYADPSGQVAYSERKSLSEIRRFAQP